MKSCKTISDWIFLILKANKNDFQWKISKNELNLAKEFPNWKVLLPRWWIEMKVNTEAIPIANLRVLAMRKCKTGMEGSSEMLICMNKTTVNVLKFRTKLNNFSSCCSKF